MITITAWAIFVPSGLILLGALWIIFTEIANGDYSGLKRLDNWIQLIAMILLTFIPGVYLFGW